MIRRIYIRVVQGLAPLLRWSGLDRFLSRRRSFWVRHLWSLFAIYDVRRMALVGKPWWVYGAIDEVERFLDERGGRARVFEYGAGSSTLWLSSRAGEVHSVEHDGGFVEMLRPMLADADHVQVRHVAPEPRRPDSTVVSEREGHEDYDFAAYAGAIEQAGGPFDLIVVDGRARVACLEAAASHLAPGGLLLFDDAGRDRYRDGLARSGFDVRVLKGLAPSAPWPETTALLRARADRAADQTAGEPVAP